MRTVNPTRSFVLEHNMTEQLSCDAISIPEWKLELMAKKIFEKVWGNQNKAILRACKMIESCQNGKAATRMSAAPIRSQIEKSKSASSITVLCGQTASWNVKNIRLFANKPMMRLLVWKKNCKPSLPLLKHRAFWPT